MKVLAILGGTSTLLVAALILLSYPQREWVLSNGRLCFAFAMKGGRLCLIWADTGQGRVWDIFIVNQRLDNGEPSGRVSMYSNQNPRINAGFTWSNPYAPNLSRSAGFAYLSFDNGPATIRLMQIPAWPFWVVGLGLTGSYIYRLLKPASHPSNECPACHYDLRGSIEAGRCPECGRGIDPQQMEKLQQIDGGQSPHHRQT